MRIYGFKITDIPADAFGKPDEDGLSSMLDGWEPVGWVEHCQRGIRGTPRVLLAFRAQDVKVPLFGSNARGHREALGRGRHSFGRPSVLDNRRNRQQAAKAPPGRCPDRKVGGANPKDRNIVINGLYVLVLVIVCVVGSIEYGRPHRNDQFTNHPTK